MSSVVDSGSFGLALSEILDDFEKVEESSIKQEVRASGNLCKAGIKAGSPTSPGGGGYAAGWSMRSEGNSLDGYYVRVYNRKKPGLAHLLEKGHALRNGGRSSKFPHIAPAYEKASADLKRRLS